MLLKWESLLSIELAAVMKTNTQKRCNIYPNNFVKGFAY